MGAILTDFIANGPAPVSIEDYLEDDFGPEPVKEDASGPATSSTSSNSALLPAVVRGPSLTKDVQRTSNPHLPTRAELRQQLRDANREAAELVARVQALLDEETTRRSLDTAETAQTRLDSVLLRCRRLSAALGLQPSQPSSANLDSQNEVRQAKVSFGKSSDSDEEPQRKRQKVEGAKVRRTFRPHVDLLSARRAEYPPFSSSWTTKLEESDPWRRPSL